MGRWGRIPVDCGIALSQCPGPLSICWTGGHGRSNTPGADSLVQSASPGLAVRRNQAQGDAVATRSTKLAQLGRYVVADHRRDAGRPDERARPGSAVRRRDAEAVVDQQHDADVRHVLGRARRVGPVGVQDGVRYAVPRPVAQRLLRELHRETRTRAVAHRAAAPGEHPVDRDHVVPAIRARLLPVRVRRDHPDPGPRVGARARELQGVDPVLRAVDHVRVRGRRVPAVGRRLLRPARRGRLLRRLRDPPVRRRGRVRRRGGDRTTIATRPRDRRAEQRRDGRGRGRIAVARLERVQRRRPVRVEHVGGGGGAQHQPVHRGGAARSGSRGTT